jgi:hypothetical protein
MIVNQRLNNSRTLSLELESQVKRAYSYMEEGLLSNVVTISFEASVSTLETVYYAPPHQ